jgi:hypothetical protein
MQRETVKHSASRRLQGYDYSTDTITHDGYQDQLEPQISHRLFGIKVFSASSSIMFNSARDAIVLVIVRLTRDTAIPVITSDISLEEQFSLHIQILRSFLTGIHAVVVVVVAMYDRTLGGVRYTKHTLLYLFNLNCGLSIWLLQVVLLASR